MIATYPSWVQQAATFPLAFAQVREDPWLDQWVVDQLTVAARVCMVASGGCTAALLSAAPNIGRLHLVDANPAQLALSRLKLRLLATHDSSQRMALLGHAPMPATARRSQLAIELTTLELPAEALGPPELVGKLGPDHAGRYERVFAELRATLVDQTGALESLLSLHDPAEQERRVSPQSELGRRLDESLDKVMALPHLVRLFGEEATKNPVEPFSRHFARRIRHVLATLPAKCNPYLSQMLLGHYPASGAIPWLSLPRAARMPRITWDHSFMAESLANAPSTFDFVHLSNILDWLTPETARATLESTWRALRPGGWTLIRQLNSDLRIPKLAPMFAWLAPAAAMLHRRDRSFFYRDLFLGRKP